MRTPFSKSSLQTARDNIATLFDAFCRVSRMPPTITSEVVSGDVAFIYRYRRSNFSFETYDRVAGRFSALWPQDAAWPTGVPRPAPAEVPADLRAKFDARKALIPKHDTVPMLPGNAAWPDDIPAPGSTATSTMEASNG